MAEPEEIRYGVFLTPDAKTSAAVTGITSLVRAQFGLVSAGRFPPHVTLAGSLPVTVGEQDLLAVVGSIVAEHATFLVHNRGIDRLGASVVFDVHHREDGRPNAALLDLVDHLVDGLAPQLRAADGLPADLRRRDDWHGHLSLASHELDTREDLRGEVETFIRQLDTPYPSRFPAATVTVYRLHHPSWRGPWWTDFSWEHCRSFSLGR